MVATRTVRTGLNPNVITEKNHPGEFLVSALGSNVHHENATVEGGVNGVEHNSVLINEVNEFAGIVYEGVPAGMSAPRAVLMRGPCEVSLARLVFPSDPAAVDGDSSGDVSEAEQAEADAALKTALIAEMTSAGIVVRD